MKGRTRRESGRIGKYLYVITRFDGVHEYTGFAKWEANYMMRTNNGVGRGWKVTRWVRATEAARGTAGEQQ